MLAEAPIFSRRIRPLGTVTANVNIITDTHAGRIYGGETVICRVSGNCLCKQGLTGSTLCKQGCLGIGQTTGLKIRD